MRSIPEALNKVSYWYRTTIDVPATYRRRRTWLHFGGVNYAGEIWLNSTKLGTLKGAFARGDFDITGLVKAGKPAGLAVLVAPQPHAGLPHEHTVANGTGHNGGQTAIDGPTFLSTIGWDWLMAVRDRDTGLWQPVALSDSGPVTIEAPHVVSHLSTGLDSADLNIATTLTNHTDHPVTGMLVGTIIGESQPVEFRRRSR
jgi:mannosylglycoprotein endo-beta-mannosidase